MNKEPNDAERYEAAAYLFYRRTGLMAPGKDSPASMPDNYAERRAAWDEWQKNQARWDCLDRIIGLQRELEAAKAELAVAHRAVSEASSTIFLVAAAKTLPEAKELCADVVGILSKVPLRGEFLGPYSKYAPPAEREGA